MAAPKIFVTGATGYVGGDAMFVIMEAHPEWSYSFLVRDRGRIADLTSRYCDVRIVIGDLNDTELIKLEASSADIVMTFASSDDVASAEAVLAGMASDSSRSRFWIHTSGTANLLFDDRNRGVALGDVSPKVWDDVEDLHLINSWPQDVLHRPVEKIVLEAGDTAANVKSAVIVPPAILGVGRGPGNKRTIQVPILIDLIRKRKRAFQVGRGEARWSFVHIHDLSKLYLLIAEAAAVDSGVATWGRQGYYFAENGEMSWGEISSRVAKRLFEAGVLTSEEVDSLDPVEAGKLFGRLGPESVGGNSRSRATRAKQLLGWSPSLSDMSAGIDEQVVEELKTSQSRLQDFKQGHMPKTPQPARTTKL